MGSSSSNNFSVLVPASDLGIDARPFSSKQDREGDEQENWHDCSQQFSDEDFSDLDFLQFFRLEGSDKSGNRIFRIVGKYFPGQYQYPFVVLIYYAFFWFTALFLIR
ncbi:hypothetical protein SLEP1_g59682 [Rubroshorea leprosula]|uniref:Uncharacterized protein n=1 Tax=Rubroshorea leprosula TaxID=152421 RepID=A0AAV5MX52_9ROSI|nr:hypothetical protein SLEP1_g59682 [Rubroshorea leprosula]